MISTLTKKHSFDLVFDSQKVFRLLLEAMSNPARVVNIYKSAEALYGDHPAFLALAMTLLDNEVSYNACENAALSAEIASLTLSKSVGLEYADFVFVSNPNKVKDVIGNVKCGTLPDPHKSATVIIRNDDEPECRITISGPGINGQETTRVSKTVTNALRLRDEQHYEYPQGIDLLFVSGEGEMSAFPRLVGGFLT